MWYNYFKNFIYERRLFMSFIEIENLSFEYNLYDEENEKNILIKAIDGLNLKIEEGSFVAILGHNGCGKSTLAKHFSGILKGCSGNVIINNMNTLEEKNIWEIRKQVGTVFQNPDNQIVATVVEDDVAFGAENLGIDRNEILKRVENALNDVEMTEYRKSHTANLSGGQKQRVAIAGILAMQPKCIVLDEPTSMLDPKGRKEVIETIKRLNKEKNITIILITHYMEEVIDADRLIVMEKGKIVLDDTPLKVFRNVEKMKHLKLTVPEAMEISYNLNKIGFDISLDYLKIEHLAKKLLNIGFKENILFDDLNNIQENTEETIKLEKISHIYGENTVFEKVALNDINLQINKGDFYGIIGHTGSGKSTLIQLFNALLYPNEGNIFFNRQNIFTDKKNIKNIRQKIGVVFQHPEYQLFEETVFKDVCFAPKNMGLNKDEIEKRAKTALEIVGIPEKFYKKSPFELSGGEKRRVAIAGILAMQPSVIVFDELAAGLDPVGKKEILSNIKKLHEELNITIVLISHSMEDICEMCNKVLVLNNGKIILNDYTKKVFENANILEKIGLGIPNVNKLLYLLNKKNSNLPKNIYTMQHCLQFLSQNLIKC